MRSNVDPSPMPPTNGANIDSLPTETLSAIFRLVFTTAIPYFSSHPAPALQTELKRVANASLLIMSRVCSQWHDIAIYTPNFWSDVEVNGVSGRTPSELETTIALLSARLERSRDAPLSISITCEDDCQPFHPHIFELLAQHSPRWEIVLIGCSLEGVDTSVLSARLPRLKKLVLNVTPPTVDFFGIAPRLNNLYLCARLLPSESLDVLLRLKQLRSFGCRVMFPVNSSKPYPCCQSCPSPPTSASQSTSTAAFFSDTAPFHYTSHLSPHLSRAWCVRRWKSSIHITCLPY
ncbi:hypothetical protein C8F04DRAFT_317464 [Mycena alexandri]|uniref:F-box domain-containing protein n=1 Tax=Mycena alexandri TaxID=1745969 RepID=A0AAD6XBE4_9AGAR|nr:hypothetical protein C8F04DRAFT_317464 [Mycena alexandri]